MLQWNCLSHVSKRLKSLTNSYSSPCGNECKSSTVGTYLQQEENYTALKKTISVHILDKHECTEPYIL